MTFPKRGTAVLETESLMEDNQVASAFCRGLILTHLLSYPLDFLRSWRNHAHFLSVTAPSVAPSYRARHSWFEFHRKQMWVCAEGDPEKPTREMGVRKASESYRRPGLRPTREPRRCHVDRSSAFSH